MQFITCEEQAKRMIERSSRYVIDFGCMVKLSHSVPKRDFEGLIFVWYLEALTVELLLFEVDNIFKMKVLILMEAGVYESI